MGRHINHEPPIRFAVLGGGPAGTAAASAAASLGAQVVVVEKDVVGGAAHLWDCIPSKTMQAASIRTKSMRDASNLGVVSRPSDVDLATLANRIATISGDLTSGTTALLESQDVVIHRGVGRFTGAHELTVDLNDDEVVVPFDIALVSTGSVPRVPDWAEVDGTRVLSTRDAYDLDVMPQHMIVVGSGVTGVEFVNIFSSFGSDVSLLVSRQQVLPHKDPEVASTLEFDFLERGVRLLKGARADGIQRTQDGVVVHVEDGRTVAGSHALLAIGSVPLSDGIGLESVGVSMERGHILVDEWQRTSVPHIYAAGDVTGQMPLSSVATMQGRKIAQHAMGLPVKTIDYSNVAQAIFTEPEIASVGLEEAELAAAGRRVRVTKVPFASNSRSVIQAQRRGFVKVYTDPATHEVLGGTIVGHRASELIGILALAVQGNIEVGVLVETLMVHPSLSESLAEAAY